MNDDEQHTASTDAIDRGTPPDELLTHYGLTTAEEGIIWNYADENLDSIPARGMRAARLIGDSLSCIADALKRYGAPDYFFSDDDTDYLNAIRDQVNRLTDLRIADDTQDMLDGLLETLNYQRDENAPDFAHEGFIYGYADHYTPISKMMLANYEEA